MLGLSGASKDPMVNKLQPDLNDQKIRNAAIKLEATFLSEMLKSAGIGNSPKTFGGGAGEEHFSSFLRDAQASEMSKSGGIGLAEVLYRSMKENIYD